MTSQPPIDPSRLTIPAATLIVFRHAPAGGPPELMMLERALHLRFAGGASVFPGGRIDPADRELAQQHAGALDVEDAAARIAAIRETLEEAGLLLGVKESVTAEIATAARAMLFDRGDLAPVLSCFGLTLDLARLVPFARWCPRWDRAFDTRFYLADLGTGDVAVLADGTESTRLYWASAADTLRMADAGEVSAIFPTICNLQRLAQFGSYAEAVAQARAIPPQLIAPWREDAPDGRAYLNIPTGAGYPIVRHPIEEADRGHAD